MTKTKLASLLAILPVIIALSLTSNTNDIFAVESKGTPFYHKQVLQIPQCVEIGYVPRSLWKIQMEIN